MTAVLVVLYLLGWLFAARRIIVPSSRPTVVLAFDVGRDELIVYRRLVKRLRDRLDEISHFVQFRVIVAPPDLVRSRKDAERLSRDEGMKLVLWGRSETGSAGNVARVRFRLHYTWSTSAVIPDQVLELGKDLAVFSVLRRTDVSVGEDLRDIEVLADDLVEMVLFLTGVTFCFAGKFQQAAWLFRLIQPAVEARLRGVGPRIPAQLERLRLWQKEAAVAGARQLDAEGRNSEARSLLEACPDSTDDISVLLGLARIHYKLGDVRQAAEYTNRVGKIDRRHLGFALNNAFLGIVQGNYARALIWYDKVAKYPNTGNIDLPSVIEFLEHEYANKPQEHALLFGLGIVNGLVDQQIRRTDLRKFVRRTNGKPQYEGLRKRALEILSRHDVK